MAIQNTSLSASTAANVYVSSGNTVVSVMYFCNTDTSARNLSLYAIPSGGSVSNGTKIYSNVQIAIDDTLVVDMEKLVLANGDYLVANATGTMTATVSYVGI